MNDDPRYTAQDAADYYSLNCTLPVDDLRFRDKPVVGVMDELDGGYIAFTTDEVVASLIAEALAVRDAVLNVRGDGVELPPSITDELHDGIVDGERLPGRRRVPRGTRPLAEIHKLMDGKEWSADTTEAIAQVLIRAGFTIREPFDAVDETEAGSDRVVAETPGVCPHCGNRADDPETPDYFDNTDDEFTYCYACEKHATNPRWKGRNT